jgi:hypothetical protein
LALALALMMVSVAVAAAPRVLCHTKVANGRVLVDIELLDFYEERLLQLVKLGLAGSMELEVAVVKPRRFWFDAPLATEKKRLDVRFSRMARTFVLDGKKPLVDPNRIRVERLALRLADFAGPGSELRIEVRAALRVVTTSTLGTVARWIARGEEASPTLSENVVQWVTDDLARKAETDCTPESKVD